MKLEIIRYEDFFDPTKVISSSEYYDKKKHFTKDGLFSEEIFGENGDDKPADIVGWIDLGDIKIISPVLYTRLARVLKNSILNKIISYNKKTDEEGLIYDEETKSKPIEYQNIGIPGFIANFEDIMEMYARKELPEYKTVMEAYEEDKLFTSVFPVFSSKLRPGVIYEGNADQKTSFKYDDINNYYNIIIKYSNDINDIEGSDEDEDYKLLCYPMLYNLQDYCNKVIKFIIDNFLKGKKGCFRKIVASTRVNFSSRNVITPMMNAKIDDVVLPYLTFLELYRFLLINLMVKTEHISYNKADEYIQKCKNEFDPKIYKYMKLLVEKGNLKILLNRNPSINIGSIILLNVAGVKSDFTDLTLSLPNMILSNLNGDYDGDVLNIIALLTVSQKSAFVNLSPRNLIISKNNAKFDRGYSLAKDCRAGYYILNN